VFEGETLNSPGIVTVVKDSQLHKEPAPIVSTLLGILIFSMDVP